MASNAYNGWAGVIRDIRGTDFYKWVDKSKPTDTCTLCGDLKKHVSLSYHAEEYGSTWNEYISNCFRLCPRCHGMIHMRFKFPNIWARYVHKVRGENFGGCTRFTTLNLFFAFTRKVKDIPMYPWVDTGIPFIDSMPRVSYSGLPKIACIETSNGVLLPDPKIYASGWGVITGMVLNNKLLSEETFYE